MSKELILSLDTGLNSEGRTVLGKVYIRKEVVVNKDRSVI